MRALVRQSACRSHQPDYLLHHRQAGRIMRFALRGKNLMRIARSARTHEGANRVATAFFAMAGILRAALARLRARASRRRVVETAIVPPETDMFSIARLTNTSLLPVPPVSRAPGWEPPARFDPQLIGQLLQLHEKLNARFAHLLCAIDKDADDAAATVKECLAALHELRRQEAVRLYPVIARGIDGDAAAHSQLMQLRMVMVALVRRVGRNFDELLLAIGDRRQTRALVERISAPLADCLRRSATEVYPLYTLMGMRPAAPARRSA